MLGDVIEQALAALGVTEEKVSRWLGRPCNCRERKDKLNALHGWALHVLRGHRDRALDYLQRLIDDENPV